MESILVSLTDLLVTYKRKDLAFMLGWQDIKQRYRRSKLGPFWLTISMVVMISMIGVIFGQALKLPLDIYWPYLATGIIFWNFISVSINEGATSYISSAGMIRQLAVPLTLYPFRVLWRNILVLIHNIVIIPFILLIVGKSLSWNILLFIPAFILLVANLYCFMVILGIVCTRFRDMPPIVGSLIQVFFYITPILWMPNSINSRFANCVVQMNPFYHLIEIVRAPLLGDVASGVSWIISASSLIIGATLMIVIFGIYKKRIAYWI